MFLAIWLPSNGAHPVLITIRILKNGSGYHFPKEPHTRDAPKFLVSGQPVGVGTTNKCFIHRPGIEGVKGEMICVGW
jgi:hypothetical protein